MSNNNNDRFISKPGETTAIMPNCKSCKKSYIDHGLKCGVFNDIPLQIRLNKQECDKYEQK